MEEVCANKAEFQELKSVFFRMDQKMDALMEMVKKLSTKESASGVRDREAEKANSATVTVAEERPTIDDEVLSQFSDSGESKQLETADQFKTPGVFVGDRKKQLARRVVCSLMMNRGGWLPLRWIPRRRV